MGEKVDVVSFLLLCKVSRTNVSIISSWASKCFSISPILMFTTPQRICLQLPIVWRSSNENKNDWIFLHHTQWEMHTFFVWLFRITPRTCHNFLGPPEGLDSLPTGIVLLYPFFLPSMTLAVPETSRTTSWLHLELHQEKIELSAFFQIERIINWWISICPIYSLNVFVWTQLVGAFPEAST